MDSSNTIAQVVGQVPCTREVTGIGPVLLLPLCGAILPSIGGTSLSRQRLAVALTDQPEHEQDEQASHDEGVQPVDAPIRDPDHRLAVQ